MAGEMAAADVQPASVSERVLRHAAVDRVFHWVVAASVLILLATGLLPVVGVQFSWVTLHWITGIVLTVAVVFHIVQVLVKRRLRCMTVGPRDFREGMESLRAESTGQPRALAGKYTLAQKLMHHAMTLMVLTAVVTGLYMLARIDSPFWERNPYLLGADTWGVIYVLHGLAALMAVTLVMIHIYFGLLPEKRVYLRAMLTGWASRVDLARYHDPKRWLGGGRGRGRGSRRSGA